MPLEDPREREVYLNGFKEGQKHNEPSPETRRFMDNMERDIHDLVEKQEKILESIKDIGNKYTEMTLRAVNWDNTNRIVYGLVALILVTVIGALITLVVR